MTDIHVLELIGTERDASLAFHPARLESLAELISGAQPHLRVLGYSPGPTLLAWSSMQWLHEHVHKLLHDDAFANWLRHHDQGALDITSVPRFLTSSVAALRAQAELAEMVIVLDVNVPESVDVDALVDTWQRVMDPGDAAPAPRSITRMPPPSPRAAAAANNVLRTLLTDPTRFLDSETVGRRLSRNPDQANPRMVTSRARQAGRLIGVWDGNAYRYPAFQFDASGQPLGRLSELIAILPADDDGSGRNAALWLFAPDAALSGRSPAEAFASEPDRVIGLHERRTSTLNASE